MSGLLKNILMWLFVAVTMFTVFSNFSSDSKQEVISYSEFLAQVESDQVLSVEFQNDNYTINGKTVNGKNFETVKPPFLQDDLSEILRDHRVSVIGEKPEQQSILKQLLVASFPILIILAVFIFFMRQMQGGISGKSGPMSFGRSKAKLLEGGKVKTNFTDVAGIEEAKEEVQEIVDFLQDPSKFQKLGGKIPTGILMVGSPGTGKTLLSRAIAGEAQVPFFTISGSDFVEMFVGVGASRVRDMFEQAKKHAPCIVFIDEIDAVGRHRGAGLGGGHDEREQTLNQLLVEMDGFEQNEGIIIIAATNRPDVLDPALLRPGRFDRQIIVPLPDIRGREQILKVHMKKVPLGEDVDPSLIARGTPGFSGADLANLVNEAALYAARSGKKLVGMEQMDFAKDKVMMGTERRSMVISEEDKLKTAYHEAGHAIVGRLLEEHDPVYKVTVIPRGRALGVTVFLPEEDKYSHSRQSLLDRICGLYGGRIAEEIVYGEKGITTGASNDIERATELARNMITKWGLSKELGPIRYGDETDEPFLGRSVGSAKQDISDETASKIDKEAKSIISDCYMRATDILKENIDNLHLMAQSLVEYETLDAEQIDDIMAGAKPRAPGSKENKTESKEKKDPSVGDTAKQS
ncbi:MAG TPA: ATP-dependent metallopeptidase FtsH/Yme1/Tma family protein [Gammaproteobacteria bacterium]|nr:ATP-dependent metallopeptidase FtsH/Yme1/Tma family protein [Gammaproteobacteria bacterium]